MPPTKYRHTLVYQIDGLHLGGQNEAEVIADPEKCFRAILTTNPDNYCFEADRFTAVSNIRLNAIFGEPTPSGTLDDRLTNEIEKIKELRKSQFGGGLYLVLIKEGEVEVSPPHHKSETEDFIIWLDGVQKEPLRQAAEPQILDALASLLVAAEDVPSINKVCDAIILSRRDGKPIYSYTLRMSAEPSVLHAIPGEAMESIGNWYETIAPDQELARVKRLLVSSLQTKGDPLRSFLAAWPALEIFIQKTFKAYEEGFFRELFEGDYPEARSLYLARIRGVMKDKYRLVDKFALIASFLCPESADEDIESLKQAKEARDALSHGQDVDEALLPVRVVQNLTRKYLYLHLAR